MIPHNLGKTFPHTPLSSDEVESLISAAAAWPRNPERWGAMVATMARTGCRSGELCATQLSDLDLDRETLNFTTTKSGRPRTVGLSPQVLSHIRAYLSLRGSDPGPLFTTCPRRIASKSPVSTSALRRTLPQIALQAGITSRVSPHCLRHSLANQLADDGVPMRAISKVLGHASVAVTIAHYQAQISESEAISIQQRQT